MTALGFVAIARPTFDVALANQLRDQARATLTNAGFQLVGPDDLVMTLEGVDHALRLMSIVRPDVLIVLQTSFADSTLLNALVETAQLPILLWAAPEEPIQGRLRLNSFSGMNLAAHSLKRIGVYYDYLYARPDDPRVVEKAHTISKVAAVARQLYATRIGRVGDNPVGYTNAQVNYEALQLQLGISVEQIELSAVFHEARSADPKLVALIADQVRRDVMGLEVIDQRAMFGTLSLYTALRKLVDRHSVQGLAVRTAPEIFTELNCAASGALSLLNNEFIPCSPDVDVNSVISQLLLQWLSNRHATSVEIVGFDHQQNTATLWHNGHAPLSMADPLIRPRASVHPQRQLPLAMEFILKPGRVTIARLSETMGSFRLMVSTGEMLQMPLDTAGGSEVALNIIMHEGLEQQLTFAYGDHTASLLALATMIGLPVVRL
jgi:L-fucose isomerase-like protein